jgi:hypothetical protein
MPMSTRAEERMAEVRRGGQISSKTRTPPHDMGGKLGQINTTNKQERKNIGQEMGGNILAFLLDGQASHGLALNWVFFFSLGWVSNRLGTCKRTWTWTGRSERASVFLWRTSPPAGHKEEVAQMIHGLCAPPDLVVLAFLSFPVLALLFCFVYLGSFWHYWERLAGLGGLDIYPSLGGMGLVRTWSGFMGMECMDDGTD